MIGKIKDICRRTSTYCRMYGKKALISKIFCKLTNRETISYEMWRKCHMVKRGELAKQSRQSFEYAPSIGIFIPGEREKSLQALLSSIENQSYKKHRLYFGGTCGSIQEEYVLLADRKALLAPNALYEYVAAINKNRELEFIYSDEDCFDRERKVYSNPNFKPEYNPDMLRSTNYIGNVFCVKRELLQQLALKDFAFDGVKDYALVLGLAERTKNICRIPKVLFHMTEEKLLGNPEAVMEVLKSHYERIGVKASVETTEYEGIYRTKYALEGTPAVSIIIANKDHREDLKKCVESVEKKTAYDNYEIIIVENNSTEEETFQYYKELEASNERVRILYWEGTGFKYPDINNYGAKEAKGEYLLFLNNDTEVLHEDWLTELVSHGARKEVGAVGARLYYEDGTIQHAGVILGLGTAAGHAFVGAEKTDTGYQNRIVMTQNHGAVTAACILMRKEVFKEVGGFDTAYAVAFNDADLCMKITAAGYWIVYTPYVELFHYESKSRGIEDTVEKQQRFGEEVCKLRIRWEEELKHGGPCYNPNLTLERHDFSFKL